MELKTKNTERGFALITFTDLYGTACSIQKSSLATEDAIWFGVDDLKPQVMASQARLYGVDPGNETTGWVPYPIPDAVHLANRMHLSVEQVKELIPILQHFVDTNELP